MLKKYWWLFVIAAPSVALLGVATLFYYKVNVWTYQGSNTVFEVKPGEGFSRINAKLDRAGLISSAKVFHRYNQITDNMTDFKAGLFEIKKGDSMLDIINTLTSGKTITISATIPEGKNLFEIAEILKNENITTNKENFIRLAKSEKFARSLGIPGERLEGYLYPDTYMITPKSKADYVLKAMVNAFESQVSDLDFSKAPRKLTKHQVITLASVVEKETGAAFERPIIAGVFINRLRKGMRLQSDPTTIYGIYENYNGNLRKKHLLQKTPYNTYKVNGLPAGPISNPGRKSIQAVLNPSKHNYLYFVSKNDGTHIFTENYRDHRKAVNDFQKNSRARQGKSWRDLKQNN